MKRIVPACLLLLAAVMLAQDESFHRAQQDREISYWLLEPSTHQFSISHDFTVTRVGQKSVHSFVRKGSVVSPDAKMTDLDTGKPLKTSTVAGKDVNALGAIIPSRWNRIQWRCRETLNILWAKASQLACGYRKPIPIQLAMS